MHFYQRSGAIAFENRLYYFNHINTSNERHLTRAASGEEVLQGPVEWSVMNPRWPCKEFVILFHVQNTNNWLYFMRENSCHSGCPLSYIDEINPAFRRLQRWMRRCSRSRRAARELAFAMALHARLGIASPASVLHRGFAIVRDEQGQPVARRAAIRAGQRLNAEFSDGTVPVQAQP